MNKRVIIVHGWNGSPKQNWFPWLKKELEKNAVEVIVPQLPDAGHPRIGKWVTALARAAGDIDENTFFAGHSLGCQAIARLLEKLPEGQKCGGVVFVAGFFKRLTGLENDIDVQKTDKHWLTAPIDLNKVREHIMKSVALFSDDDPYVPLDNQDAFRDMLGAEIITMSGLEHFSGPQNSELPIALEKLLQMSK